MSNALAIRHTAADSQARVNAASNAQVKRYWPGRAPDWYEGHKPEEPESESEEEEKEPEPEEEPAATSVAAPVVLKKVADPRLARLSAVKEEDGVAAPRVISRRQARGESDEDSEEGVAESEEESEEEDEEVTNRRMAVRERLKKKKAEEEELLAPAGSDAEEPEEEEEEESEYETESEDEQLGRQMLKPIFVTKKDRETIAEREALEKEELKAMKREKAKLAERASQTKELVVEQLRLEEAERKARKEGPKELGDIDTDDEKDPEAEYETWRIRELQRIRCLLHFLCSALLL